MKLLVKNVLSVIILASFVLLYIGCGGDGQGHMKADEEKALSEEYGCKNLDDCLTKYNFEGARAFAVYPTDMRKVITQEANYWGDQKDYDRAYSIIKEGKDHFHKMDLGQTDEIDLVAYNAAQYQVIATIVEKLIDEEKFKDAKKWAIKVCADCNAEGKTKEDVQTESDDPPKWDADKTMDKLLLAKIKKAEHLLK